MATQDHTFTTEEEQASYLRFVGRLRTSTDLRELSQVLEEAINDLTVFDYTALYIYLPERDRMKGVGPSKRSPEVRKGERFLDMRPSEAEVDLTRSKTLAKAVRGKKPMEVGGPDLVKVLQELTGRNKKQVQTFMNMVRMRRVLLQPITMVDGGRGKDSLVGILLAATPDDRIEKRERDKVSKMTDHMAIPLMFDINSRRLEMEVAGKEGLHRIFSAINKAAIELQRISDEDAVFKAALDGLKGHGMGFIVLERSEDGKTITFKHFTTSKALADSMRRYLSDGGTDFTLRSDSVPFLNEMFNRKGPVFVEDLVDLKKAALKAMGLYRHGKKIMSLMGFNNGFICPVGVGGACDRLVIISDDSFRQQDMLMVEAFSLHIRNAVERIRLQRESDAKSKHIQMVNDLQAAMNRSLEVERILTTIYDEMSKVHRFDHVGLLLLERGKSFGINYVVASPGEEMGKGPVQTLIPLTEAEVRNLSALEDVKVGTGDLRSRPIPERKVFGDAPVRSRLIVPLKVENTFHGALNLGDLSDAPPPQELVTILGSLKGPVSTSVSNACTLREEKRRLEQLKVVNEVSRLSASMGSLESLYKEVVRLLSTRLGHRSVSLIRNDRANRQLSVLFSSEEEVVRRFGDYRQPSDKGLVGKAVTTKTPIIVVDIERDPDYVSLLDGTRSELVVPVMVDGEVEVLINIESQEVNAFDDIDLMMTESVANEVSVLIKTLRIGRLEEKRIKQLSLISDISREILSLLDEDRILRTTVSLIEEKFSYLDVTIFLMDDARENLVLRAANALVQKRMPIGLTVPADSGIIGLVVAKGETVLLDNVLENKRYMALHNEESRSELCCAIRRRDEVIGVINIESPVEGAFDKWDKMALESLALEVGKAIESAEAYKEMERRSKLLELVNDISLNVSKELRKKAIMDVFVGQFQRSRGYLDVAIFLLDEGGKRLVKQAQAGDYVGKAPPDYAQNVGVGLFGACLAARETIIVNDVSKDKRFKSKPWLKTKAEMISPIILGDACIGVINVESDRVSSFDKWDRLAVDTLSRNLAIVLRNADLFEEEKRRSDLLRLLNDITTTALRASDVDALLEAATHTIQRASNFLNVSVFLEDMTKWPLRLLSVRANEGAYHNLAAPGTEFPVDKGLVGWCYSEGETVVVNDTRREHRFVGEPKRDTLSELCTPIRLHGRAIGVLNIESERRGTFTEWEVMAAETVSDILSRAIMNIHQMGEHARHSRDITAVVDIEKDLASQLDADVILDRVVSLVQERLGYQNVEYHSIDVENYDFVLNAVKGTFEKGLSPGHRQNIELGVMADAYRQKRMVMANDIGPYKKHYELIGKDVRSAIAIPVISGKEVMGVLNVEAEEPNAFNEWDTLVLIAIAELLAGALERTERYMEQSRQEERFRATYEITREVGMGRTVDEVLKRLVKLVRQRLNLFHVEALTRDEKGEGLVVRASAGGFRKKSREGKRVPETECVVGWCMREGSNALVNDVTVDPRCREGGVTEVKSEVVALLRTDAEVFGVISAKSRHFDAFSEWDLATLESIAALVGNILTHMRAGGGPSG